MHTHRDDKYNICTNYKVHVQKRNIGLHFDKFTECSEMKTID